MLILIQTLAVSFTIHHSQFTIKKVSKKKRIIIENITVQSLASEGKAIAKHDEMVVFLEGTQVAPGDIVTIEIHKKKKSYAEARVLAITTPSPIRIAPVCEHFGVCGGCKWQHLPYSFQLEAKYKQVKDNLERLAKIPLPEIPAILGSNETFFYRNKLEFTFSNKKWLEKADLDKKLAERAENSAQNLENSENPAKNVDMSDWALGFHVSGRFDKVLDLEKCHLQSDPSNEIRNTLKEKALQEGWEFYDLRAKKGFLRNIIMRIASKTEIMLAVVFGENNPNKILEVMHFLNKKFPQISSLQYFINEKLNDSVADLTPIHYAGKPYLEEKMEELTFRVGAKSFYQTNSAQAYQLYSVARDFAGLTGEELVYDLYTGTGTIANFVAKKAKKVIGIEYVTEAIEDAKVNSEINQIDNTLFFAGDMKNVLTKDFLEQYGSPDVIITDPPRAGMHEDVVKVILEANPKKIVYVSCNPATQARDIAMLYPTYKVEKVQPVDMFPQTHHVENVILMVRN